MIYPYLNKISSEDISLSEARREQVEEIERGIKRLFVSHDSLNIVFLCTHNSRRSQFAEFFGRAWVNYFDIAHMEVYSAGVELTQVHNHVADALDEAGFLVSRSPIAMGNQYPIVLMGSDRISRQLYSKTISDELLPKYDFITIAVCDHAAESCPIMPGSLGRFVLPFTDPGKYDDTSNALSHYRDTRDEIAQTLYSLFKNLSFTE